MQKDLNKAEHAAGEEARGWEEQGRCHAADGNQHLHLGRQQEHRIKKFGDHEKRGT